MHFEPALPFEQPGQPQARLPANSRALFCLLNHSASMVEELGQRLLKDLDQQSVAIIRFFWERVGGTSENRESTERWLNQTLALSAPAQWQQLLAGWALPESRALLKVMVGLRERGFAVECRYIDVSEGHPSLEIEAQAAAAGMRFESFFSTPPYRHAAQFGTHNSALSWTLSTQRQQFTLLAESVRQRETVVQAQLNSEFVFPEPGALHIALVGSLHTPLWRGLAARGVERLGLVLPSALLAELPKDFQDHITPTLSGMKVRKIRNGLPITVQDLTDCVLARVLNVALQHLRPALGEHLFREQNRIENRLLLNDLVTTLLLLKASPTERSNVYHDLAESFRLNLYQTEPTGAYLLPPVLGWLKEVLQRPDLPGYLKRLCRYPS